MRVMAQMGMVMNLDKCIGCHTCSVTCKQAWTNRAGTEYVWFNNVETRPGQGYPRRYEDQEKWHGGWALNKRGKLVLKAGGRVKKLFGIFASPVQPELKDYYEPWTYDYKTLVDAPLGDDFPVARPKSLITGEDTKITWSANWDDDLGGSAENGHLDPIVEKVRRESEDKIKFAYEQTFMFYLPRICEHCLNPSCMASCPSGAIYKRVEDGIVLVDQDKCRGWRQCVTGCPYKKIYFNHKTGKAEKCTFCYPRVEVGLPDGLLRDLRGPAAVPGAVPVRRRRRHRGGRPSRTPRNSTTPRWTCCWTRTTPPSRPRPGPRASRRTGSTPPGARRSTPWPRSTRWPCRCTRNTGPCRWSGTCRRSHPWWTCCATRATTARTPATFSAPSTRCASRWNTSRNSSPPATRTGSPRC